MLRKNKHNLNYKNISVDEWFNILKHNPSLIGAQSGNTSMGVRFEGEEVWTYMYEDDKRRKWQLDEKDSVTTWFEKRKKEPTHTYWITDKKHVTDIEDILDML